MGRIGASYLRAIETALGAHSGSTAWRRTAGWLWKLRMDQAESVLAQGKWNTTELDREVPQNQFNYDRPQLPGKLIRLTDDFEQVSAISPRAIADSAALLGNIN